MENRFTLGRSADCSLVMNHACVSSCHAFLNRDRGGKVVLVDNRSSNGTYLNSPRTPVKSTELGEGDIVFFSPDYRVPGSILLAKFEAWEDSGGQLRSALAIGGVRRYDEPVVKIGSARRNTIVLPYLSVRPDHAEILRDQQGRFFIRDLGGGLAINGKTYNGKTVSLRPNDSISLGGVSISISFDPDGGGSPVIGTERRGFYLRADKLSFTVKDRDTGQPRALLNQLGFSVLPGELVGLLGPSGCGKTTLLNCLSGAVKIHGPFVSYDGQPLSGGQILNSGMIGYVPQDDIMHPELTVRETLYYSARLRTPPSTKDGQIYAKIDEVCATLGLVDKRSGLDLRDTLIGSPQKKTLSGGQKKRVNLAIELLTDPLILFLDEPTSGLSSRDTRVVMESLRELVDKKGISIIITIHQPSLRVYQLFDKCLYLKDGQLAYFGPAFPDSVRYFEPEQKPEIAGPDAIMESLDERPAADLQRRYRSSSYHRKFVDGRSQLLDGLTSELSGGTQFSPTAGAPVWLQIIKLFIRYWRGRLRDPVSLAIQIGQAPLIAFLVGHAFADSALNSALFLLVLCAVWFGTNNASRELVSERDIFSREKRSGVGAGPVLASKVLAHSLIIFAQTAILVLVASTMLDFDFSLPGGLFLCWVAGLVGIALGFAISALAKTEVAAIVATPLVLIPFILFGGLLTDYDRTDGLARVLTEVVPLRWAYEAIVQSEQLEHEVRDYEWEEQGRRKFRSFSPESDREAIDDGKNLDDFHRQRIGLCVFVLLLQASLLLGISYRQLRLTS